MILYFIILSMIIHHISTTKERDFFVETIYRSLYGDMPRPNVSSVHIYQTAQLCQWNYTSIGDCETVLLKDLLKLRELPDNCYDTNCMNCSVVALRTYFGWGLASKEGKNQQCHQGIVRIWPAVSPIHKRNTLYKCSETHNADQACECPLGRCSGTKDYCEIFECDTTQSCTCEIIKEELEYVAHGISNDIEPLTNPLFTTYYYCLFRAAKSRQRRHVRR